ncbi:MAG: trypsin-like peptidase domain-containing protein [Verrucomicrobiota bacterium]
MRRLSRFCVLAVLSLFWIGGAQAETADSVVKIVNQYNRFSWYTPWASGSTGKGTGSGFVISGNRIMSNAHVVSDAAMLLVYFHNDPQPYPARVVAIGHDCDLAILELEDKSRIAEVPALEFNGLPALRSRVVTYGYPSGGKLISSTVGVVSRIEPQSYVHAGTSHFLAAQTDAAINPGNSGGPVIQDGKVVGVAFQGNKKLENMGFFIPIQIIEHFLTDIEDGEYDGFPDPGIRAANLENPAARTYAGMKKEETGIRVEYIYHGSSPEHILQPDDIITAVDGYAVANDGTVDWNGMRINCMYLADFKQIGETIRYDIIRGEERLAIDVKLNNYNPSAARAHLYDQKPTYYIYAGLVFASLNRETLKTYSDNWIVEAPQELVYETYYRPLVEHDYFDTKRVVQIRRLDHEVNAEETRFLYRIIKSVNETPIRTLQDLADAFEKNKADQHVIRFEQGNRITVLDREKADAAHEEILQQYAIPKDRRL